MQWIATAFAEFDFLDAVIVEADDEPTAARLAAGVLIENEAAGEREDVHTVFIAPWDGRHAYVTTVAVERAPMDCCGGNAPAYVDCSPHWGTCSARPGAGQDPDG